MSQTPEQDSNAKKAQVQDYFSRTAESYVASFSHRAGDDLQRLIELGEWNSQQQAIDLATGGGHTALAVAPHVAEVTVTDLTPRILEKAREYILSQGVTNAQFEVADAEQLPFPAESFERVTCRIAAHHFPNVAQAVYEVVRVLKPGGLFLLIDCMAPSDPILDTFDNTVEKWRDPSHGRSCTPEEWQTFSRMLDCGSNTSNISAKCTNTMIGRGVHNCRKTKKQSYLSLFSQASHTFSSILQSRWMLPVN